jgi:two-component sensor histidine kinase
VKNLKRYVGPSGSHKRTILIVENGGPNNFVSRLFLHAASYVPENSARAFLFGFCCVALAALIKAGALLFGATLVFATFYPAVLLSALVGGLAAGIVAILLSAVVGWLAFMPPELSSPGRDWSNLVFFAANAMLIVWLSASYRGLLLKVLHHEREREFLLNESQHRSKNLLQVVHAIVSRSLQAQPSTAEKGLGRLKSLSIADQLLFATEARRVGLRELLNAQLEMHGSQISLVGQAVELDAPLARTQSLL